MKLGEFERPMPNSPEAERAMLGHIQLNNSLMGQAIDLVKPEDFHVPANRRVYHAMLELYRDNADLQPPLIAEKLKRDGFLEAVGGYSYLTDLTYGLPHTINLEYYAKVLRGKATLRQIIKTSWAHIEAAYAEEDDPDTQVERLQSDAFSLARTGNVRRVMSMRQVLVKAREYLEGFSKGANPALPTPWVSLNNLTRGGMHESELWGLAAIAKHGKSATMKQWAQFSALLGERVLVFTREMSEVKLIMRMLAALTEIPVSQIRYGLDDARTQQLIKASHKLEDAQIFLDAYTSNVNEFKSRVREMIRLEGITLVMGDYLQLFKSGKKTNSRADEIGYVWRTFKETAQDLNTRVFALAQFSRDAFKADPRPMFHQVEGSGEGEKAVDVGMVLNTRLSDGQPGARPSMIHIDYQRDEEAGTQCELIFNGRTMEFWEPRDLERKAMGELEFDV
jgi:replicative DNA helicase